MYRLLGHNENISKGLQSYFVRGSFVYTGGRYIAEKKTLMGDTLIALAMPLKIVRRAMRGFKGS
jgi:hypothetical protein